MDLFRFRCYLASLQGGELPNPKRLLAVASRPTKLAMGRLGIFSVSSFHALVNGLAPLRCYVVALHAQLLNLENVASPNSLFHLAKLRPKAFSVVFRICSSTSFFKATDEDEGKQEVAVSLAG